MDKDELSYLELHDMITEIRAELYSLREMLVELGIQIDEAELARRTEQRAIMMLTEMDDESEEE